MSELYGFEAQARRVAEPPKRSGRTPFERDRGRIVHSAALRRLSAKTQVMGAGTDDFVRNRLTHTLEVAQVARELGKSLGCEPDIVDSAALSHDLGHPPFGHNGEVALDLAAADIGGFEGNAQTLRLLTRLEPKTVDAEGRSVGLNLTRGTLRACVKYPWRRGDAPDGSAKFGVYDDDAEAFDWLRADAPERQLPIEAQVMGLADDIAYSVHDIEDGVDGGWFGLLDADISEAGVLTTAQEWYESSFGGDRLDAAFGRLKEIEEWPGGPYDGSRAARAAIKSLTSALIGRFAGAARVATREAWGAAPLTGYTADVQLPAETRDEIIVLKALAAHFVMRADHRMELLAEQRATLAWLVEHLHATGEKHLEPEFAADFLAVADDACRRRVLIDQVASLTDVSAAAWASRLGS